MLGRPSCLTSRRVRSHSSWRASRARPARTFRLPMARGSSTSPEQRRPRQTRPPRSLRTSTGAAFAGSNPPKGLDAVLTRWSPDGTKLVYQERTVEPGNEFGNLVVEDLASGRRTQVTDLKEGSGALFHFLWPHFSADGQNVIFHLPQRPTSRTKFDLWSVPVTGGKPTLVLRDASFPVPFPDGKSIAYVPGVRGLLDSFSIAIADSSGSRPRTLVRTDESFLWLSVSPDGSKIAYTTNDETIHVVEIATGTPTAVAKGSAAEWLDDDTLIINPD